VSDEDAAGIDYAALLKEMQATDAEENRMRKEAGLTGLRLIGWAEPPRYDAGQRKLHWAKTLQSDAGGSSLNYDIRILGREGVLSVQAVAGSEHLETVKAGMAQVLSFAEFTEGNRYDDYDASTDRLAVAGIAALIAGGAASAASKGGLLKGLLALLLAGKKLLIPVVIGLGMAIKSLFGGKPKEQ
jgi:uncharacterized membrane-anchored protein